MHVFIFKNIFNMKLFVSSSLHENMAYLSTLYALPLICLGLFHNLIKRSKLIANRCKVMIQAAESDEDGNQKAEQKTQKTVSGALYAIWKSEGLLGFFKGLHAQILKTVLSSALLLMIKEKITKTTWVLMLALKRYLSVTRTRLKST